MYNLIDRQAAIDILDAFQVKVENGEEFAYSWARMRMTELPSAKPTLYGYNYYDLELIAIILQKENLPPDRVVEALTDIGRIIEIIKGEFEEELRATFEDIQD